MVFETIQPGPPDPMNLLKTTADADTSPDKVDLGVGIYRNEKGNYQELATVREAKVKLLQNDPGHDYECTTGNVNFIKHAAGVMFGRDSDLLAAGKIASVQTISGTGAVHLAAQFISRFVTPSPTVYVGTPTWGNYRPLCELVGLQVVEFQQYDAEGRALDFPAVLAAVRSAPRGSVFIFQACCHNPTGMDPTRAQWNELRAAVRDMGHFPVFDNAYQGLGDGLDEDAYAVRSWAAEGIEMFVCQSFSKNFALYGERCGVLHAFCPAGAGAARNVHDQLRCLIRWEFSSSPAYGSRLVSMILSSEELRAKWENELSVMRQRIKGNRELLFKLLTEEYKTPGNWQHILEEKGLFSYFRLSPAQCRALVDKHHIYLPTNGRINISGLNAENAKKVACKIDEVVRDTQ
ncbi:hypothetical protein MCOR25_008518 [Pyricularia grisea]|nr:hypothetical protein MCOR25_008518 [Pyricularia grisea]